MTDTEKKARKKRRHKKHRGNGEGSVYACPGGGYRAALTVGWKIGADGKKRPERKFFRGKTAQEAMDKRDEERKKLRAGEISRAPEKQSVEQFMNSWLKSVTPPMVRQKTYDYYAFAVDHINDGLGKIALKKLHPQQIQEFLSTRLDSLSVKTCHHLRGCLRTALNWAVESCLIAKNPAKSKAIRLPKIEHQIRFMPVDEMGAFRAAARGNWLENALNLDLASGIRQAELLGLQWPRIDLEKGLMRIEVQLQRVDGELALTAPKTKKALRTLRLNPEAIRALTAQKMQQERERQAAGKTWQATGFVFTNRDTGAPIDQRTLLKYFYKVRDAAAIKGLTFHGLRHTYASVLLARGTPIKEVSENLGHSDVAFTLRIYAHCMPDFRDKAANEMQAALAEADRIQREKEEKAKRESDGMGAPGISGAATGAATSIGEIARPTIN